MNLDALHRVSLRRMLIVLLLAGVMVGSLLQVWLTWQTARSAVNAAFDRSLLGAVKAIDANVSTESGGLAVELPYVLFEFFELTANGPVHYRVATLDGLVEIGSPDLPMPAQPLGERQPHFDTVEYAGAQVRIATYQRALAHPIGGSSDTLLVIQVAEPFASRDQFGRRFLIGAIARDALLAALAAAAVAAAVAWALRPLRQLRQEVAQRAPDDLSPMDTSRVPRDVLPLVEAMNQHILRNRELLDAQRRFVDDASHQLRTPLSTLQTQLSFAQRASDLPSVQAALAALREQLRHAIRQTNQMLALARADSCDLDTEAVDLAELASEVTRSRWPQARAKDIDLGLETPEQSTWVQVQRELLEEALANLIDNALRYTPAGGRITVEVAVDARAASLGVRDSGPGIPPAELPRAMQRFFRASNAQGAGSGLGLAIVASIARRHQGRLELLRAPQEGGLWARIGLPRAGALPTAPSADRTP
ncbi:sensor histidine kinase [Comamonas endophytica]|uniref:histidine kinase n=2 Tax=Comamonas endophytica TaxID=2949090 RepID=A0ABY6GF83_9BURK|nr:sensor histidine kinase [Acidovorax sp. 5MLIR]MCD2514457.1 sensor histidine kinase N-terminal domain-containing protein [Acidovorax sp. D4N7]UYG53746.1 sensor histidine kinase N-terminal domain-containing protein [Acidovorax sp. 5MLIR]